MTNKPIQDEIVQAVNVIKKLPRGLLPRELFYAISEKIVIPAIEICPVRMNKGKVEFLLSRRPIDDPYWPNAWHIAGVILLASDKEGTYEDAFQRILDNEFRGVLLFEDSPQFVMANFFEDGRGRAFDRVYFLEILNEAVDLGDAEFFSNDNLPNTLLEHYYDVLKKIEGAYLEYKK